MKKVRFYQASTSELFGETYNKKFFNENSKFYPKSPYGVAKLYSYWITSVYRESYGIYACNGILFNHESPRRGETFVTRKITRFLTRKKLGSKETLFLGNIYAKRDWGHAKDYTEMQWRILQQKKPEDYIVAAGKTYTVKHFINVSGKILNLDIKWSGSGLNEVGYLLKNNKKQIIIRIDKKYFRPNEVDYLKGDARKAYKKLRFKPKYTFLQLVKDMIKKMDIPTQLAIKHAGINHLSKLIEQSCECKCGQSPCKSCGKDHHNVKEDASKMAQAMATGTQKKIADLSTRIKDTETRGRDIDLGDKTKIAINKADVTHMKLKLADLKDKLRSDRQKRAMAAQNEPETDSTGKPNKKKEITENE